MNVTVTDILSGTATFDQVTPETCSDVTLRNLKANALTAAMIQYDLDRGDFLTASETGRREASEATAALAIELIQDLDGDILENGVNLIVNVTDFAQKSVLMTQHEHAWDVDGGYCIICTKTREEV